MSGPEDQGGRPAEDPAAPAARRLRDRLRVLLNPAGPASVTRQATDPPPPEVAFVAYTEDCRILGTISLDGDRLSDMLNAGDAFTLHDVVVESLVDGRAMGTDEVVVSRDELVAVHADRPRGDPARRTRTIPYPVAVQTGCYLIRGCLHARPGAEPLASARYRKPMIPLTDATIEYSAAGSRRTEAAGTIIVNRETADWMRLTSDRDVRVLPDAAPSMPKRLAAARLEERR